MLQKQVSKYNKIIKEVMSMFPKVTSTDHTFSIKKKSYSRITSTLRLSEHICLK